MTESALQALSLYIVFFIMFDDYSSIFLILYCFILAIDKIITRGSLAKKKDTGNVFPQENKASQKGYNSEC